jgi:hypothetical protein
MKIQYYRSQTEVGCKLKKDLYRLKQLPRQSNLDHTLFLRYRKRKVTTSIK